MIIKNTTKRKHIFLNIEILNLKDDLFIPEKVIIS